MARTEPLPDSFRRALTSLRDVPVRPELILDEIPGPTRIAPYSAALAGEIRSGRRSVDAEELASGRFVVLYDPEGQDAWDGSFRLVTLVRAPLEPEFAEDPMMSEVAWSWLRDALVQCGADTRTAGGTVTKVVSRTFGAMSDEESQLELEIRASWTAADEYLRPHLLAWVALLSAAAGLPPLPEGVVPLTSRL